MNAHFDFHLNWAYVDGVEATCNANICGSIYVPHSVAQLVESSSEMATFTLRYTHFQIEHSR